MNLVHTVQFYVANYENHILFDIVTKKQQVSLLPYHDTTWNGNG